MSTTNGTIVSDQDRELVERYTVLADKLCDKLREAQELKSKMNELEVEMEQSNRFELWRPGDIISVQYAPTRVQRVDRKTMYSPDEAQQE